jgi:SOS-response transcriptional repressor LexA
LGVAARERLAMLAWLRSSLAIRRSAPPEIVSAWRDVAIAADDLSRVHLRVLGRAVATLRDAGVAAVVLKGMPLAQRAHGDWTARASTDIDVYVAPDERDVARRALAGAGWRLRAGGTPPWEESLDVETERGWVLLELHSSLVDHNLAHLPVPRPGVANVDLDGVVVPALSDPLEPAALAAHAAKHTPAPLLWFLDLGALWGALDAEGRSRARAAATAVRLERYLEWALERAAAVEAVAGGDERALRALGVSGPRRRVVHAMWRDVTLASHPVDAARALGAWLVPRPLRAAPGAVVVRWAGRLRGPWRRFLSSREELVLPGARGATPPPASELAPTRPIALDEPLVDLVRDIVGRGAEMWLRVRGGSMHPAIPSGSLVRVRPLPARPLRRGDVVLADVGAGRCVLHRVVRVDGGVVRLHGDATLDPDPPVPSDAVLALADRAEANGRVLSLEPRAWESARRALRRVRRAGARGAVPGATLEGR